MDRRVVDVYELHGLMQMYMAKDGTITVHMVNKLCDHLCKVREYDS